MNMNEILAEIDAEIAVLEKARDLLRDWPVSTIPKAKRKRKRNLTPEGRRRIAEAVKRRWAAQKEGSKRVRSKSREGRT